MANDRVPSNRLSAASIIGDVNKSAYRTIVESTNELRSSVYAPEPPAPARARAASDIPGTNLQQPGPQKSQYTVNTLQSARTASGSSSQNSRSSRVAEASPEPEESLEKLSRASEDYYSDRDEDHDTSSCVAKTCKQKKINNLLLSLVVALSLLLLGTLAGLIFLAVTRNASGSGVKASKETSPPPGELPNAVVANAVSDEKRRINFGQVQSSDPTIATIFADHSLYQTFYGVSYTGPRYSNCSSDGFQRAVAVDVALLSRVTKRIRVADDRCNLAERVLSAISDIKVDATVVLSVKASEWKDTRKDVRRLLGTYPAYLFSSVLIENDDTARVSYGTLAELQSFLESNKIESIEVKLIDPTSLQPNPLDLSKDPTITRNWVVSDKARRVYTNLESPIETSEKARAMTSWVCGVSDSLDPNVAWFWSAAFDNDTEVKNGIFNSDRTLKPAGLPRCQDYNP